jgi:hypothetical protein
LARTGFFSSLHSWFWFIIVIHSIDPDSLLFLYKHTCPGVSFVTKMFPKKKLIIACMTIWCHILEERNWMTECALSVGMHVSENPYHVFYCKGIKFLAVILLSSQPASHDGH